MSKREQLIARCAAQRDSLAVLVDALDGPLKIADRGISIVRYLRRRPLVLGALAAILTASRGRGLWKWGQRGFLAWRAYRVMTSKSGERA